MRVLLLFSCLLLLTFSITTGCGGNAPTTPSDDELSQYVSENPNEISSGTELGSGDVAN